jgi:hypothetical protein
MSLRMGTVTNFRVSPGVVVIVPETTAGAKVTIPETGE